MQEFCEGIFHVRAWHTLAAGYIWVGGSALVRVPAKIVEEVGMVVRCHGKGTLALYARS